MPAPQTMEEFLDRLVVARDQLIWEYSRRHQNKGPTTQLLVDALEHAGQGSTWLRAKLLWSAYQAFGADHNPVGLSPDRVCLIGVSLNVLQAAVDIHDDVVDRTLTRRGHPTLVNYLISRHKAEDWIGDPVRFGTSMALIVGDVVTVGADRTFRLALEQVTNTTMRNYMTRLHEDSASEAMIGHFLDLAAPRFRQVPEPEALISQALETGRAKYGLFKVATPLVLGTASTGASQETCQAMMRFGMLAGEAFQLRGERILATGGPTALDLPSGGDLHEGKLTVLIGLTLQRLDSSERRPFIRALQRSDALLAEERVSHLQQVITNSGALEALEEMIQSKIALAATALTATGAPPKGQEILMAAARAIAGPTASL
ncbi:MAG: polyprenyl synthetase family protein [Micrococcales bacterium]|nr:polyprenyl synthetase family protein [Micrococcales bacterium]